MMFPSRLTRVAFAIGGAACIGVVGAVAPADGADRACTAAPGPAGQPARARDDAPTWNLLSRLPLATRAVVAVQGLADQLDDASISPVRELARARLIDRGVNEAWENLAKRLSWSGREALERLLGSRVVLAIGEAPPAAPPPREGDGKGTRANPTRIGAPQALTQGVPWAVFSEVDERVAAKLTVALAGVPRRIEAGRPVYSLEGGAFLLSTSERVPRAGDEGKGGDTPVPRTWILVGAREHAAWFEALHASVFGAGGGGAAGEGVLVRLSAMPAYEELARMGLGDVAVLVRMTAGGGAGEHDAADGGGVAGVWEGYLAISGRERAAAGADCGGYVASVAFVSGARAKREMVATYPLVPDTRFDALASGAIAAVVQMSPEKAGEGQVPFRGLAIPGLGFSVLGREMDGGGGGEAGESMVGGVGRSIMVLRPDEATGRAMLIEAKRVASVEGRGEAADGGASKGLDRRMGEVMAGGRGGAGAAEAAAVAAMSGLLPGVRRAIVFEPVNASPLRVLVGSRVAAAWVERPTAVGEGAGGAVWWAAALAGVAGRVSDIDNEASPPGQAARTRASAGLDEVLATIDGSAPAIDAPGGKVSPAGDDAIGGGQPARMLRRWVSIGRIDVPALARLMGVPLVMGGAAGSDLSGILGRVGVASWRLWADESGALHGDVDVGGAAGAGPVRGK